MEVEHPTGWSQFQPLVARTHTAHRPVSPAAYDCVRVMVIRDGSAIAFSEFGQQAVRLGDVIVLGANTLFGGEPEDRVTLTTIYADTDYVIDQVFWQHVGILHDRLDAQDFAATIYTEPAQILRLGEDRAGMLMPWLDELVALSLDGPSPRKFYRMQALLFAVLDVITPYVRTTPVRRSPTQRKTPRPADPPLRQFAPLRDEVRQAAGLLRDAPEERWTLQSLAAAVHLSPSQLGRLFVDAYGKSPISYLMTLRAERLAGLLRETHMPIEEAMRQVGWNSRGHAARLFRQAVGVTPTRYRQLVRHKLAA